MAEGYPDVTEELLSAAADGELTEAEQQELAAALTADATLQARIALYQALRERTAAAYNLPLPTTVLQRMHATLDAVDAESAPAARPGWLAGWRRPAFGFAGAALAALLAFGVYRTHAPVAVPATQQVALRVTAPNIAAMHHYWQREFAARPVAEETPLAMADRLTRQVGFHVTPPRMATLGTWRLLGCAGCQHSVPGRTVPVFLLQGPQGETVSMFELYAPDCHFQVEGFRPAGPAVQTAEADGVHMAMWSSGPWHVCLASGMTSAAELARLAPQALEVARGGDTRPPAPLPLTAVSLRN